jgi:transcriptional regulator with XRE-family HTH domain
METYDGHLSAMATALRKALEDSGLNELELAARIGVSEKTMRRYLKGETAPSRGRVLLIAATTGAPFDSFPPPRLFAQPEVTDDAGA